MLRPYCQDDKPFIFHSPRLHPASATLNGVGNSPHRFGRLCLPAVAALLLAWRPPPLCAQEDKSFTLSEVVSQVLAVHPLTEAARARVQAALGLVRQAQAYPNPTFAFANNNFALERTYGLTQSFEWPFKRTYRVGVAQADEQITEGEQEGVRQDVITAAREAFFTVLLAQEGGRVAETFVQ